MDEVLQTIGMIGLGLLAGVALAGIAFLAVWLIEEADGGERVLATLSIITILVCIPTLVIEISNLPTTPLAKTAAVPASAAPVTPAPVPAPSVGQPDLPKINECKEYAQDSEGRTVYLCRWNDDLQKQ